MNYLNIWTAIIAIMLLFILSAISGYTIKYDTTAPNSNNLGNLSTEFEFNHKIEKRQLSEDPKRSKHEPFTSGARRIENPKNKTSTNNQGNTDCRSYRCLGHPE